VASLKPKLFCGVAFRGEKFPSARVGAAAATHKFLGRGDTYHLRHNNCQTTILLVEQRLHTYRTNRTLLCLLQTPGPKRETIRMRALSVKPSLDVGSVLTSSRDPMLD
jgi:hypothetical protein